MNDNVLRIKWSKKEKDFLIHYPRSCDGHFIKHRILDKKLLFDYMKFCSGDKAPYNEEVDFIEELERRGYDKTTLKFEIKLKY